MHDVQPPKYNEHEYVFQPPISINQQAYNDVCSKLQINEYIIKKLYEHDSGDPRNYNVSYITNFGNIYNSTREKEVNFCSSNGKKRVSKNPFLASEGFFFRDIKNGPKHLTIFTDIEIKLIKKYNFKSTHYSASAKELIKYLETISDIVSTIMDD